MLRSVISFVLSALLLSSWGAGALAQTQDTIRLTNGEWQPYLSQDVAHHGFASHVVTEAFAQVGVDVEFGFFPWATWASECPKLGVKQKSILGDWRSVHSQKATFG